MNAADTFLEQSGERNRYRTLCSIFGPTLCPGITFVTDLTLVQEIERDMESVTQSQGWARQQDVTKVVEVVEDTKLQLLASLEVIQATLQRKDLAEWKAENAEGVKPMPFHSLEDLDNFLQEKETNTALLQDLFVSDEHVRSLKTSVEKTRSKKKKPKFPAREILKFLFEEHSLRGQVLQEVKTHIFPEKCKCLLIQYSHYVMGENWNETDSEVHKLLEKAVVQTEYREKAKSKEEPSISERPRRKRKLTSTNK